MWRSSQCSHATSLRKLQLTTGQTLANIMREGRDLFCFLTYVMTFHHSLKLASYVPCCERETSLTMLMFSLLYRSLYYYITSIDGTLKLLDAMAKIDNVIPVLEFIFSFEIQHHKNSIAPLWRNTCLKLSWHIKYNCTYFSLLKVSDLLRLWPHLTVMLCCFCSAALHNCRKLRHYVLKSILTILQGVYEI